MTHHRDHATDDHDRARGGMFPARFGRSLRIMREPGFTAGDVAAFAVALIMVCGPLALGAFGT